MIRNIYNAGRFLSFIPHSDAKTHHNVDYTINIESLKSFDFLLLIFDNILGIMLNNSSIL